MLVANIYNPLHLNTETVLSILILSLLESNQWNTEAKELTVTCTPSHLVLQSST